MSAQVIPLPHPDTSRTRLHGVAHKPATALSGPEQFTVYSDRGSRRVPAGVFVIRQLADGYMHDVDRLTPSAARQLGLALLQAAALAEACGKETAGGAR